MQSTLTLGDTLNYTTSVADYPASSGWTLKTRLVPRNGGTPVLLTSAADSTDATLHRTQASAATTAAWTAGAYSWASYVDKAAESYLVATGQVTLLPNPRTAATLDNRTQAEIALDAAKAAHAAWTPTQRRYRIGDREMEFSSAGDIISVVGFWQNEVNRERRALAISKGLGDPRRTYVRVNRA